MLGKIFKRTASYPAIFLLFLLLTVLPIVIHLPVMGGKLVFFVYAEFVLFAGWIAIFAYLCKTKFKNIPRHLFSALVFMLAIVVLSAVLTLYRIANGSEFTTQLVSMKTSIIAVATFFLAFLVNRKNGSFFRCLVIFNLLINLVQFVVSLFGSVRESDFMGNIMIFIIVILVLLPVNFYYLRSSRFMRGYWFVSWVNIFFTVVFTICSKSRIAIGTMVITALIIMFAVKSMKIRHFWKTLLIVCLCAFAMSFVMSGTDIGVGNHEMSDSFRIEAWKESISRILASPFGGHTDMIFIEGKGLPWAREQSSHNFILELCLCYGIPGALLFACVIISPFIFAILKIKREKPNLGTPIFLLMLASFFAMFSVSFFQSTFFAGSDAIIYWTVTAAWSKEIGFPAFDEGDFPPERSLL